MKKLPLLIPPLILLVYLWIQPSHIIEKQLPPGKHPGTYHFSYEGRVSFSDTPENKTVVSIQRSYTDILSQTNTDNDYSYNIQADLPPGKYTIYSNLPDDSDDSKYWDAFGGSIEISESGILILNPQEIIHLLKIKLIEPIQLIIVDTKRPTLKWTPVEDAKYYTIIWHEELNTSDDMPVIIKSEGGIKTSKATYKIEENLVPDRRYEWLVEAFNDAGEEIAYYSSGYFRTDKALQ